MRSKAALDFAFRAAPVRKLSFADHLRAAAAGGFTSLAVASTTYDDMLEAEMAGRKAGDTTRAAGITVNA